VKRRPMVLVDPPAPPGATANRDGAGGLGALTPGEGGFRYPPLALATAAAALRQEGYTVLVVDAPAEGLGLEATLGRIPQQPELFVVLSSWATAGPDEAFLQALRAARPGGKVLLLASVLGVWESGALTRQADAWLLGDGELYVVQAVKAVAEGASGLLTPQALGLPGYSEEGRRLALAGLPVPAWDLLPWKRYPFLTALTSRGCPDGCAYCPYAVGQGEGGCLPVAPLRRSRGGTGIRRPPVPAAPGDSAGPGLRPRSGPGGGHRRGSGPGRRPAELGMRVET